MSEEKNTLQEVDIEVGEIEMPSLDMTPYIGKKAEIVSAKVVESPFFDDRTGKQKMSVFVETEVIDTIGDGDNAIQIKGTRFLPLYWGADDKLGWGEKTQTGIFLKENKCKTIKDLVGKKVVLQIRKGKKDGKDYLTIV